MSVKWHPMETYLPNAYALFWVVDSFGFYAVFGTLETGRDGLLRVWDDNGAGYALAEDCRAWAECSPPAWIMN